MKHSKLIVFLSALLAVMMLLASCGDKNNDGGAGDGTGDKTVSADVNKYTADEVNLWLKYLGYNEPEGTKILNQGISYTIGGDSKNYVIPGNSNIVVKVMSEISSWQEVVAPTADANGEYTATKTDTITVYNVVKDGAIWTKSVSYKVTAERELGGYQYEETEAERHVEYRVVAVAEGIVGIEITTPTKKTVEDVEVVVDVVTYDFMYENGTVFASGLEDFNFATDIERGTNNGCYDTVTIDGKVHVFDDGELVTVFDSPDMVTPVPVSDEEYNGFNYAFDYSENGSLSAMGYDRQLKLQIIDSAYRIVNEISVNAYGYLDYHILNSGDVLVTYALALDEDAKDYAVEYYGEKCELHNLLVKKDGTTSELELNFVIGELYSAAEETDDFVVKGDYNVVYGYDITEGEISERATVYVLDNNLTVVETLPNLLLNQCGMAKFISSNKFVVPTAKDSETTVYYLISANGSNGVAAKYVDLENVDYDLGYGFIVDGVLYRNDMSMICDLDETYDGWDVEDGNYVRGHVRVVDEEADEIYNYYEVRGFYSNGTDYARKLYTNDDWYCSEVYEGLYKVYSQDYENETEKLVNACGEVIISSGSMGSVTEIEDGVYSVSVYNEYSNYYTYYIIK